MLSCACYFRHTLEPPLLRAERREGVLRFRLACWLADDDILFPINDGLI